VEEKDDVVQDEPMAFNYKLIDIAARILSDRFRIEN